jgi:hypothetical protein
MFAAQMTGVPTVNGASGSEPPAWEGLQWARVRTELAAQLFRGALEDWVNSGGIDPARVQWIQLPPNFRSAEGMRERRQKREDRRRNAVPQPSLQRTRAKRAAPTG